MKNLFKNYKLSAFGILFIILVVVAIATWFVPAGEYVYKCSNGQSAFVYSNGGQDEAICPISQEESDQLVLAKANAGENGISVEDVTTITQVYDASPVNGERPGATLEYQRVEEPKRQGVWNVVQAPVDGFIKAIEIIVFVFAIGGFINIVIQSGAMDAGIYALLRKFKGRELWLIPILMTLFSLGGTSYGMAEETIVFYIVLIPILFRAGFDNAVGMMVIALGAGVGVLASTVNPFAIGVAASSAGISPGTGIVGRSILYVVVLLIAIAYVMHYAKKVYNDPTKSINYDKYEQLKQEFSAKEGENKEVKMTGAHKVILALFALTFILMILSVIPWEDAFGVTIFDQFTNMLNGLGIPFMGGDTGLVAFGHWYFVEMTGLFLAGSFVIGCVAKGSGLLKGPILPIFIDGAKDMMSVGLIIGLARGIQIILENSGMAPTILYYGSQALSHVSASIFSILAYIFYIPLSFLVPSTSGLATASMPIVGDLAATVFGSEMGKVQAITGFSAASGLVNLITPTSGVIMAALSLSKMEYGRWIKLVTPLLIILFIVSAGFLWLTTTFGFFS